MTTGKQYELALTEQDLVTLVEMLTEATQHKTTVEYSIDCSILLSTKQSHKHLTAFVVELLQFDPEEQKVYASFPQLLNKMIERRKLEVDMMESGGLFEIVKE